MNFETYSGYSSTRGQSFDVFGETILVSPNPHTTVILLKRSSNPEITEIEIVQDGPMIENERRNQLIQIPNDNRMKRSSNPETTEIEVVQDGPMIGGDRKNPWSQIPNDDRRKRSLPLNNDLRPKRARNPAHIRTINQIDAFQVSSNSKSDTNSREDNTKKQSHNTSAKKSEHKIVEEIKNLKKIVPNCEDNASKATILTNSFDYIDSLIKDIDNLNKKLSRNCETNAGFSLTHDQTFYVFDETILGSLNPHTTVIVDQNESMVGDGRNSPTHIPNDDGRERSLPLNNDLPPIARNRPQVGNINQTDTTVSTNSKSVTKSAKNASHNSSARKSENKIRIAFDKLRSILPNSDGKASKLTVLKNTISCIISLETELDSLKKKFNSENDTMNREDTNQANCLVENSPTDCNSSLGQQFLAQIENDLN